MPKTLSALSDRVLGLFLPKAHVGACACGSWDGSWYEYRCYLGQWVERRSCHYNCYCQVVCGSWVATGGDC